MALHLPNGHLKNRSGLELVPRCGRGGGGGGGRRTIYIPISTEGSGIPTMRLKTGSPVYGLGQEDNSLAYAIYNYHHSH